MGIFINNFLHFYYSLMHNINQTQLNVLVKFKETILVNKLLENFSEYDNSYLLRFLRARKFDLEKSYAMFSDYIKWRISKRVDGIFVRKALLYICIHFFVYFYILISSCFKLLLILLLKYYSIPFYVLFRLFSYLYRPTIHLFLRQLENSIQQAIIKLINLEDQYSLILFVICR